MLQPYGEAVSSLPERAFFFVTIAPIATPVAPLSQASFLHVREGRNPIGHARLNEHLTHSSTSPLYPIIASNDITAAMMDGSRGTALIMEANQEAVGFRQMRGRIRKQFQKDSTWFFQTWNAEQVRERESGNRHPAPHARGECRGSGWTAPNVFASARNMGSTVPGV